MMCEPTSPSSDDVTSCSSLADQPALVRPEAERPGREAEAAGDEQARGRGAERAHGRQHGPHHQHAAGGQQRDRHDVVHLADQVAQAVDEPPPARPPSQPR